MSQTEAREDQVVLEEVLSRENLVAAWKAVKANDGAPGVDRKTIEQTWAHLQSHWEGIREKLYSGAYQPAALRVVEITKASGGVRRLGIPTVQDRLIQQALHRVMSAALDPHMSEHSYGFRPNRSAHDAVQAARGHVAQGRSWVVDIDLRNFFDQVNHDRLMTLLSSRIADKRVLKLIGRYLRAPLREADGTQQKRTRGTPQGGPISPLLANLYLDPLDRELERRGIAFVRYADDIALFVSSERSAQRVLASVKAWLKKHLDLELNDDKSGAGPSEQSKLLGFRIHTDGSVSVAPSALTKLKERVRMIWNARTSMTQQELREKWCQYTTGWWNYFRLAPPCRQLEKTSGWIRRHMRKYFWQRWHNTQGRQHALRRLQVPECMLKLASSRRGAWRMAKHAVMHRALPNAKLARSGFALPWELAG
jgi:RNA-directed DNA polymerase